MLSRVLSTARTTFRLRALDVADRLRGRTEPLVPPRRLNFVGPGDFVAVGDEFLGHFTELAQLRPDERVLDIGCGIGRMARPLAGYLADHGGYDGFDVSREGIEWCRRHYRGLAVPFRFDHADVANALYNPGGGAAASEFRFPYPDEGFDFAFAISVFTHLVQDDAANYLAEAARVLRPGGRLLSTWFVLDSEARAQVGAGKAAFELSRRDSDTSAMSAGTPEEAIAFDEGWVRERFAEHGLAIGRLWPGTWSGLEDGTSFQDIVVATRA